MRFFISSKSKAKSDSAEISVTNSYIEIELPIDADNCFYLYIIPRGPHSAFVAVCLDDAFDSIFDDFDEDSARIICDTWPTLAQLLCNGKNDKYQNGALIKLEDCDYGDVKWFVASIAGNISFDSPDEIFSERTKESIGVVLSATSDLISELNNRRPDMIKEIGLGLVKGALGVLELYFDITLADS